LDSRSTKIYQPGHTVVFLAAIVIVVFALSAASVALNLRTELIQAFD
jgi:hypothetical protein